MKILTSWAGLSAIAGAAVLALGLAFAPTPVAAQSISPYVCAPGYYYYAGYGCYPYGGYAAAAPPAYYYPPSYYAYAAPAPVVVGPAFGVGVGFGGGWHGGNDWHGGGGGWHGGGGGWHH